MNGGSVSPSTTTAPEQEAREHFERVSENHEMEILREDGVYRHLRFAEPGRFMYSYDLVTWPGHLAINGDLDSGYTFARITDMVDFFASGPDVNPGYWAEKITSPAARDGTRVYSEPRFHAAVEQAFENAAIDDDPETGKLIREAWAEHVEFHDTNYAEAARELLRDFGPVEGFEFCDSWEWDLRDWDHHFLLCCFAIRAGVDRYLAGRGS